MQGDGDVLPVRRRDMQCWPIADLVGLVSLASVQKVLSEAFIPSFIPYLGSANSGLRSWWAATAIMEQKCLRYPLYIPKIPAGQPVPAQHVNQVTAYSNIASTSSFAHAGSLVEAIRQQSTSIIPR